MGGTTGSRRNRKTHPGRWLKTAKRNRKYGRRLSLWWDRGGGSLTDFLFPGLAHDSVREEKQEPGVRNGKEELEDINLLAQQDMI